MSNPTSKLLDEQLPPLRVTIERQFRIANIPVTQWQYAIVMGNNPSKFQLGQGSTIAMIDGTRVPMRPNNPIENVTSKQVNEFLRVVNEWSKNDDKRIYSIFSNHIPHAVIRLPTEEEWEYVARNCGKWTGTYPDGVNETNFHEYGWTNELTERSVYTTHPVCELKPIIADENRQFYDLLGNVWEYVDSKPNGYSLFRGGDYRGISVKVLRLFGETFSFVSNPGGSFVGFRVVEEPLQP